VIGDVAASIGTHELGTDRRRVHQHVGRISPHAQRVDVGVFECEQVVVRECSASARWRVAASS